MFLGSTHDKAPFLLNNQSKPEVVTSGCDKIKLLKELPLWSEE
jgi:hypothetical protein